MEEITICPACNTRSLYLLFSCTDHTVSHETFQVFCCHTCTLGITTPRPKQSELYKYYLSENYISHSGSGKNLIDKLYLIARKFTLRQKRRLITKLTTKNERNLLDYGCGTGEFLRVCRADGWVVNGVEPSPQARAKAKTSSINVYESLSYSDKTYNVITLWHVLEHIPDLSLILKELVNKLTPNGTIVVAVPNYMSYDAHHYKKYWAGFDVPRHLWHFSPLSIQKLLDQHGLQLKKVLPMKLDSYYVSLLSEKHMKGKQTAPGILRGFLAGLISNIKAIKTRNYSSLIYIISR